MNDQRFLFWQKWLIYANVMTLGVGLLTAFAGNNILFEWHNEATRALFFDGVAFPDEVLRMKNWLFGIIGGTIVGFHVLMIFIAIYPFKNKEKWSYRAMWIGLLSWFIIDSSISQFYGATHNVLGINLVALLAIGIPLVMTRKAFS